MKPLLDARTKALIDVGFVSWVDLIAVMVFMGSSLVLFFWWLFGDPSAMKVMACGMGLLMFTLLWAIVLVFRCCWFVLQTLAELKNMPAHAAKLAVAFSRTGGTA